MSKSDNEFAKKIVRACEILGELMCKFENYKKSKNIHNLIIKLNDVEEECDNLYLSSMRELSENNSDMLLIVSWREIFIALKHVQMPVSM